MKILFSLLMAFNGLFLISGQLQCRDESGEAIDWYVVYKFPKLNDGYKPLDTGYCYAFITSDDNNGWTLSDFGINETKNSIFGRTLWPLYSSKLSYIEYNNGQPEEENKGDGAHAKGVLASDANHAFWLIHNESNFAS